MKIKSFGAGAKFPRYFRRQRLGFHQQGEDFFKIEIQGGVMNTAGKLVRKCSGDAFAIQSQVRFFDFSFVDMKKLAAGVFPDHFKKLMLPKWFAEKVIGPGGNRIIPVIEKG